MKTVFASWGAGQKRKRWFTGSKFVQLEDVLVTANAGDVAVYDLESRVASSCGVLSDADLLDERDSVSDFDASKDVLITCSENLLLRTWRLKDGQFTLEKTVSLKRLTDKIKGLIKFVRVHSSLKYVAIASTDGVVMVLSVKGYSVFESFAPSASCLEFSRSGLFLGIGDSKKRFEVHDLQRKTKKSVALSGGAACAAWVSNKLLVVSTFDSALVLLEFTSGALKIVHSLSSPAVVGSICGDSLACCAIDSKAFKVEIKSSKIRITASMDFQLTCASRDFVAAGAEIYSSSSSELLPYDLGSLEEVLCVCVFNDFLYVGTIDREIRKFELRDANFDFVGSLRGHSDAVLGMCFSESGCLFSISKDDYVKQWKNCDCVREFPTEKASCLDVFKDLLITGSSHGELSLIDLNAHQPRRWDSSQRSVTKCKFSPKGDLMVSCGMDKSIKVWDSKTLKLKHSLSHARGVTSVAFSKFDPVFATTSLDASIRVWSLKSFKCVRVLVGHNSTTTNCAFVEKGLISSAADGSIKHWNLKSSQVEQTLELEEKVWDFCFHKDALIVGVASGDLAVFQNETEKVNSEIFDDHASETKAIAELNTCLKKRTFGRAFELAIELKRPWAMESALAGLNSSALFSKALLTDEDDDKRFLEQSLMNWASKNKTSWLAEQTLTECSSNVSENTLTKLEEYLRRRRRRMERLTTDSLAMDLLL